MKLDEYRGHVIAQKLVAEIQRTVDLASALVEVGGQAHLIVKYGLDYSYSKQVELMHGPGDPWLRHFSRSDRSSASGPVIRRHRYSFRPSWFYGPRMMQQMQTKDIQWPRFESAEVSNLIHT